MTSHYLFVDRTLLTHTQQKQRKDMQDKQTYTATDFMKGEITLSPFSKEITIDIVKGDWLNNWHQNQIVEVMSGDNDKLVSVDYEVFGRVQGVCFRDCTQKTASRKRLVGWVKKHPFRHRHRNCSGGRKIWLKRWKIGWKTRVVRHQKYPAVNLRMNDQFRHWNSNNFALNTNDDIAKYLISRNLTFSFHLSDFFFWRVWHVWIKNWLPIKKFSSLF